MPTTNRVYTSGNYGFNLDGVKCGFIQEISGGGVSADVITEPSGPSFFTKKHIGQPKYEDFVLQIGFNLSNAVYDWIAASWTLGGHPKPAIRGHLKTGQ